MLNRGSYGIEYDDSSRDNAFQRYWWVALSIPVLVLLFFSLRGCADPSTPSEEDPVEARRFDAPDEKALPKRMSIWTHFVNSVFKKENVDTNITSETSGVQAKGSLAKQIAPQIRELFDKANTAEQANNLLEARQLLLRLLRMEEASELRPFIERKLGAIHASLYLTNRPAPGKTIHTLAAREKIGKIAQQYGCSLEYILHVNNIQKPETLQIGKKLMVLQNPSFELLISKRDSMAVLFFNKGFFKRYPLLMHEGTPPPKGAYRVRSRGRRTVGAEEKWTGVADDQQRFNRDICWVTLSSEEGTISGVISLQGTRNVQTKQTPNVRFQNADIEELYLLLPSNTSVIVTD
jgi:LysM repeat protein